jgi:hypothetical protein
MVLDGLSRARQAVKDSLVLALQAEPPAKVSAMLIQEAARRAPAPREQRAGFFAKLVAVMRHPAFAAAAVIVLVAAVGGTLFRKSGDRNVADHQVASQTPGAPARGEPIDPTEPPAVAANEAQLTGKIETETEDGYTADLDETAGKKQLAQSSKDSARPDKGTKSKPQTGRRDYVEVRTPEPQPKSPDDDGLEGDKEVAATKPGDAGGASGEKTRGKTTATVIVPGDTPATGSTNLSMGEGAKGSSAGAGAAAPQPNTTSRAPEAGIADADTNRDVGESTKSTTKKTATDPYAVAKSQHAQLARLVKANKCADASKVALQISENYPDYYAQFVANDRRVKACKPYIENVRKKNAAKAKRERLDQAQEAPAPDSVKLTSPD